MDAKQCSESNVISALKWMLYNESKDEFTAMNTMHVNQWNVTNVTIAAGFNIAIFHFTSGVLPFQYIASYFDLKFKIGESKVNL